MENCRICRALVMILQLGDQSFRRQPFQVEGLDVKPEIFVDPHQGAFGDELEVQGFHQFFKKHRGEAFQAKREPHGFKFFFPIGSVHGRDAGGNMPFVIDVFKGIRLFRGKDLLLQDGEHLQDDRQAFVIVLPCPASARGNGSSADQAESDASRSLRISIC